jgi:hypothetical protein
MGVAQLTSTGVSTSFVVRRHSRKTQSSPSWLGCLLKSEGLRAEAVGGLDLSTDPSVSNNPVHGSHAGSISASAVDSAIERRISRLIMAATSGCSDCSARIACGGILHDRQRYLGQLGSKSHCFSGPKSKPERWHEIERL